MMNEQAVLGDITAEEFLARYWQRQPLCVRQAFPGLLSPISADDLAGLSLEETVESRIVVEHADSSPWSLRHGPFVESDFATLPETHWTLLVQGVDLWVPEVAALLSRFDFLPAWRVDDIMASYAPAGGSVGPHYDHYDVFLLQVEGQRRWQVGELCSGDTPTLPDCDLDILADFSVTREWVLQPGDMLYLPPCIAHWGVALDDCMTFSVGFRAPTAQDMLADLAMTVAHSRPDSYYTDPPLTPAMATEQIDPAFITQARELLREVLDDDALIADWFARFMTQPKYAELEDLTGERRIARLGAGEDSWRYINGERVD